MSMRPVALRGMSTEQLLYHEASSPSTCSSRKTRNRWWDIIERFSLFILHILSCIGFMLWMTQWVHGRNFRSGTPSSTFNLEAPLYQTQVNGIVSLILVLIRVGAGCCTAPIIWTMILILLETKGLRLTDITRLNKYKYPILLKPNSGKDVLYSLWAIIVVLLLWPPNFAAPIANSSLAWDPEAWDLEDARPIPLHISPMNQEEDRRFWRLRAQEWQMDSLMRAVAFSQAHPNYAYSDNGTQLRRYAENFEGNLTAESTISLRLPYFNVAFEWVDNSITSEEFLANTHNSDYVGTKSNGLSGASGSIIVLRDEDFDPERDRPTKPIKYTARRTIAVLANRNDGKGTSEPACGNPSKSFSDLPKQSTLDRVFKVGDNWSVDCYQIGIVTIQAGLLPAEGCRVDIADAKHASATCNTHSGFEQVQEDWAASVATNMLSEVLKYTVILDVTKPWLQGNTSLESYTRGTMTLGYHAAWSSVAITLMGEKEDGSYRRAVPMIRASVDVVKLSVWFGLQVSLVIAAALVCIALQYSKTKFVDDTTLVEMRLDLSEVAHDERAPGLCDAVALSTQDKKLPKITFAREDPGMENAERCCRRRLVFIDKDYDQSQTYDH